MSWLPKLNLIHLFDYYLLLIFLAGTFMRIRQYRSLLWFIWLLPGRWPNLLVLVKRHRAILLTWGTVLPALLALILWLANMLACRILWPQADIPLGKVAEWWQAALIIGVLGSAMIGLDCYRAFRVGKWDRDEVEKQLDQAEYWLKSWTAPMLRFLTFGFLNPRKIVGVEIQKKLAAVGRQINTSLWWVSLQVIARIAFGASVWLTWVLLRP
jgi:hypothetical protein